MAKKKLSKSLETIILCSVRYAIPRSTYMPHEVAEYIEKNWNKLSTYLKLKIQEDINNFYPESFAEKEPWNRIMALKIDDKKSL